MAEHFKHSITGIEYLLPHVLFANTQSCVHVVTIDGMPMDVTTAIRYLLADRERIRTELADARSAQQQGGAGD